MLKRLMRDTSGATVIEYGLILSMIFLAIVASVRTVADKNTGIWAVVSDRVINASSQG